MMSQTSKSALAVAACLGVALANNMNTAGQVGVSRTTSTYPMGAGSFNLGFNAKADYAYHGIYTHDENGEFTKESMTLLSQDLFMGVGLTNWADFSLDMPMYQDIWEGHTANAVGVGDLGATLKLQHPGLYQEAPFRVAYLARFTFPVGDANDGYFARHVYNNAGDTLLAGGRVLTGGGAFTGSGFRFTPTMLWTLDFSKFPSRTPVAIHANLGPNILLGTSEKVNSDAEPAIIGSIAVEYQKSPMVGFFTELSGEARFRTFEGGFNPFADMNNDVLIVTAGTTLRSQSGWVSTLGFDLGITERSRRVQWYREGIAYSTPSEPRIGVNLQVRYEKKGAHAKHFLGRFFAPEDTVMVYDTVQVVKNLIKTDTLVSVKLDTVVVVQKDTIRIMDTQGPQAIIDYGLIVFRNVNFMTGSAELTAGSYSTLDDIAFSLIKFPQVKIEVRGYTDSQGDAQFNQKLSLNRAESVVNYLVKKGVAADRLRPVGMGASNPIADNVSAEGRVLNRRVEILRVDK